MALHAADVNPKETWQLTHIQAMLLDDVKLYVGRGAEGWRLCLHTHVCALRRAGLIAKSAAANLCTVKSATAIAQLPI